MKVFVALLSLVAVASPSLAYTGLHHPVAYAGAPALTYAAAPALTYAHAPALTYAAAAPVVHVKPEIVTYSAKPVPYEANYAHGGYVAITPGAKHVAPLPYPGASHHVNLAKAPGTQ